MFRDFRISLNVAFFSFAMRQAQFYSMIFFVILAMADIAKCVTEAGIGKEETNPRQGRNA